MLTKEQINSIRHVVTCDDLHLTECASDELCRLALLGLERDERQAVTSEQAAKDIKILEQIHAKSWDEAVALRHAAEALSERDERADISAEDADCLLRWMLSERAESCVEHPTPHWVDRVVDAASAHARKAVKP